ncbi:peptidoglycan recognition protein [Ooceraea biroi]|uniref:peptidoglycan recognition protein n=1 Tax=Ooceraea biroi TaxID=2015173 RepID=UPI000F0959F1|nr:peptidoglycan recognition protein [Ooceraea biroi]XP_026829326.1 peptidoglycan recognition protein [Ooceraea biroi]XP_026829327.1 peptidoglycan recognition protein [Ooceraea biroi]XP_026829328.1 peptidoglycan recognition protein [Ooceraea biroi]XP_026829329.1 peptidoglycan recognition protein [Ooceraea biroi]XP_026829330.1 peptidoglycan recognition protein [Ooceraea biroi]XP_026829331.1 peptidoglycan recognition protein [Ooceraea biroi]
MVCPTSCKANDSVTDKSDAEQASKNQQNINTETQWRWIWIHLMICIVCIICTTLLTYVIVSWAFSEYFPRNCEAVEHLPDLSERGVSISQGNCSTEGKQTTLADTTDVSIVGKDEWGGKPPSEPLKELELPVPYVIISHTATDFCTTKSECSSHVRRTQSFHMEDYNWSDIGYNFMAGGDGRIYVGRGWGYVGAHSFGYNNRGIGISFIGTFNSVVPPRAQLDAVQKLIQLGVETGKLSSNYTLLGQRQITETLSPGDALYEIIKKWPHWSLNP